MRWLHRNGARRFRFKGGSWRAWEEESVVDAIVIGAGVGGLAAAIHLAAAGKTVRILEAAAQPGGKAGTTVLDGIEVDTGPSVLTMPYVFDDLLQLAGMRLAEEAPLRRPEPFMRYLWPDGTVLDVESSYSTTRANVGRVLGERAAAQLDGFLAYAKDIWNVARRRFVLGDAPTMSDFVRSGYSGLKEASRLDAWGTMYKSIEKRVSSPHLRDLLARYATYNGSDPRRAPATLNCIAHVELVDGASGVRGGTYELVRALHRAATTLGVEVELGCRVKSIVVEAGAARGVMLETGEVLEAGAVIANADVAHVASSLLPERLRRALAAPSEPSTSGYCAIVRARRTEAPRPAHTVLFPEVYLDEFVDLFDRDRPPISPTVYVCAQERAHGRAGWPDHEPLFVMANAPAEPASGVRDPAAWRTLERSMMDRLREAGIIATDDEVLWRRTPAELARRFPGSRGALYGAASHSWNAAFKRPANVVGEVPGLYLASGSAHPGGGLPLSALSGRAAARSILGQRG
jgi:phytoene desaturase